MNAIGRKLMRTWSELGPRFLPFADAASAELPLSRLLRLSLFQVSVGMALLLVGTLNRVMIVELGVPASLVALMISLPVLFAPLRARIGVVSCAERTSAKKCASSAMKPKLRVPSTRPCFSSSASAVVRPDGHTRSRSLATTCLFQNNVVLNPHLGCSWLSRPHVSGVVTRQTRR